MKKAQAIPINAIVLTSIGVMILVITSIVFSGNIGKSNRKTQEFVTEYGTCYEMLSFLNSYFGNKKEIEVKLDDLQLYKKVILVFYKACEMDCYNKEIIGYDFSYRDILKSDVEIKFTSGSPSLSSTITSGPLNCDNLANIKNKLFGASVSSGSVSGVIIIKLI